LFLCTPKWIFISGPSQLAHAKIIEKEPKILFKFLRFWTPQNGFLFLDQDVRALKNFIKILEISPNKLLKLFKTRSKFFMFR
jgi:hypothetical protein